MGRKKRNRQYQNPGQIMVDRAMDWYTHYYQYLTSITFQLFEWKNLPESVDPRFLEMMLHQQGYVGFYKHPHLGYLATQGSVSGTVDHYFNPTRFHVVAPNLQDTFKIFHYNDMKEEAQTNKKMGVVIWNNDYHFSTLPSLQIFAQDLAELKEVIYVNQNAQKTPVLITANDQSLFSIKQLYNQYEGNAPVILANENIDPNSIQVLKTDAPYVVDKLNVQKNAVWNEVMTFLGIKNANIEKRERMITAEADSNDEQILNSGNVFLKARREAADRINELYPDLNVEVEFRVDAIAELQSQLDPNYMQMEEGEENGKLHNAAT